VTVEKILWDFSDQVKDQIRNLPPDLKRRVWEAVEVIAKNPLAGKPLEEELAGYRSYRIGKYRLIYKIAAGRLVLCAVGPRSDIYDRFVLEIGRLKIRERGAKYRVKKQSAKTSSSS
jgi:mRNA interferase RelE/StbE